MSVVWEEGAGTAEPRRRRAEAAPATASQRSAARAVNDALEARQGRDAGSGVPDICITPNEFLLSGHGPRARTGVLLIHGLTGTPKEMRVLGVGLARAGFTVYALQLAGHCGSAEDLLASRWQDWVASVQAAAVRLRSRTDRLVAVGLSMGAVLALDLAADSTAVAGVAALSTMFRYDGWSIPVYTRLSFLLKPFRLLGIGRHRVFLEQPPYGIKDEALRRRVVEQMQAGQSAAAGLPGNPWYSIIEMRDLSTRVRRRLHRVTAPVLVIHSWHDDIASLANARLVQKGVRGPVETLLLDDSYHMVTIDRERRQVIARTIAFVSRIAAVAEAGTLATAAPAPCPAARAASASPLAR